MMTANFQTLEITKKQPAHRGGIPLFFFALFCMFSGRCFSATSEEIKIAPHSYTVLTESAPRDMTLGELKLREAGLRAGKIFPEADEIRVFKNRDATNAAPLARFWINAAQTNSFWFYRGGSGSAEKFVVKKGVAVVIFTRASTNGLTVIKPQ